MVSGCVVLRGQDSRGKKTQGYRSAGNESAIWRGLVSVKYTTSWNEIIRKRHIEKAG